MAFYFPEQELSIAVHQNDERYDGQFIQSDYIFWNLLKAALYVPTEDIILKESISVYPNPTSNHFMLELAENAHYNYPITCSIMDINGRVIKHLELHQIKTEIHMDEIPQGIYILESPFFAKKLVIH